MSHTVCIRAGLPELMEFVGDAFFNFYKLNLYFHRPCLFCICWCNECSERERKWFLPKNIHTRLKYRSETHVYLWLAHLTQKTSSVVFSCVRNPKLAWKELQLSYYYSVLYFSPLAVTVDLLRVPNTKLFLKEQCILYPEQHKM